MSFTQQELRDYYLNDLTTPDTLHGRTKAKAAKIKPWQQFNTIIAPRNGNNELDLTQMNLEKIWVWSDLHFGHDNIIKYTGRPYIDADQMTKSLITNYISTVQDDDIVIFVGDVSFMKLSQTNQILRSMPGYKILIIGNHDIDRKTGTVPNMDFDEIHLCKELTIGDEIPHQLLFTHYPLTNVPDNCINVHGHIHQNISDNDQHVNVCVEHTNFTPKPLTHIINHAFNVLRK